MKIGFTVLFLVLLPSMAFSKIETRGFVTLGTAASNSDVSYQNHIGKLPTVTGITKFGLNLSSDISDRWSFSGQLLSTGQQDYYDLRTDWIILRYQPLTNLRINIGKQLVPLWFAAEYIDVGFLLPWVVPPEEIYNIANIKAFSGLSMNYTYELGSLNLELQPFYGAVNDELPAVYAPDGLSTKVEAERVYGVSIDLGNEFMEARMAYVYGHTNVDYPPGILIEDFETEITTFGLKYDRGDFLLWAEYGVIKDVSSQSSVDKRKEEALAAITRAAPYGENPDLNDVQQLNDVTDAFTKTIIANRVTGYSTYYLTLGYRIDDFVPTISFANLAKIKDEDLITGGEQSSSTLGLRYFVSATSDFKLEYQTISVPKGSYGLFDATNYYIASLTPGAELEELGDVNIFKFAFNAVL